MSELPTVLIVDDETDIRDVVREYLTNHGLQIIEAADAAAAKAILAKTAPQVALLDINMPGEDGLSLARYIKQHHDLGVIMITAAGDTIDRIVGLEMGADDYLPKPFDLRELLARIRSVLRRYEPVDKSVTAISAEHTRGRLPVGRFILDPDARSLRDEDGSEIELTSMEFELLRVLVERPNRVLSRDQILNLTQNRDWTPFDRSIDIRITRLRRKIETDPSKPALIKTVRGIGYIFVPQD